MTITKPMLKVLKLLACGKDAYYGAIGQARGARARVLYAAQKHGLIDNTSGKTGWKLTPAGRKAAK